MYGGTSDAERIAEIVDAVEVPVLANGDVKTPEDAKRLLDITGAAGVMIGRATLRSPHLISQAGEYIRSGAYRPSPPFEETKAKLMRLFDMTAARWGKRRAVKIFRRQLIYFVKGFAGARELRVQAAMAKSRREVEAVLSEVSEKQTPRSTVLVEA